MSRAQTDRLPVECAVNGQPLALRWRGRVWRIEAIFNHWRVETGWWDNPVRRDYYKVALEGGGVLLLVYDHIADGWFVRRIYA